MKKTKEEIIAEMQLVAQQMVKDDLDENPELADEFFTCDCCGKRQCVAGSIEYGKNRLCNDCVLLAETGFALGKFTDVQALIDAMEDNRLEEVCNFLKEEEHRKDSINN